MYTGNLLTADEKQSADTIAKIFIYLGSTVSE